MPNDIMQILDPQYAADQIALQRKMALADLLRQQSMQPLGQTEAIGGWAIPKSPLEGIAKVFQGYVANKSNEQTDKDRLASALAFQGRTRDQMNREWGNPSQDYSRNATNQIGAAATNLAPYMNNTLPSTNDIVNSAISGIPATDQSPNMALVKAVQADNPPVSPQQIDVWNSLKNAAFDEYFKGNTEGYNKLLANRFELTPEQKNAAAMGQDMRYLGQLDLAKRIKEGTQTYLPNQMNILPNGQRIVAPDFSAGRQGGFDANGNAIMGAIPGSNVIAQQAGQQAGAVAAAQSNFKPQTVTLPGNRTVLASEAQLLNAGKNGGLTLQNPEQAAVNKAATEADMAASNSGAQIQQLRSLFKQANDLADTMPQGFTGRATVATQNTLAGTPAGKLAGTDDATKAAQWENIIGQLKLNVVQQMAASGITRLDIPLIRMIDEASKVDPFAPNEVKKAKIAQIQSEWENMNLTSRNKAGGLTNLTGTTPAANTEMTTGSQFNTATVTPKTNGVMSLDAYLKSKGH